MVIENVGGDVLALSIDAAKPTGVIVAYGFTGGTQVSFDIRNFFFAQKHLRGTMASDKRDLEYGLSLAREGKVRPLLDRTLRLSDAGEARDICESPPIDS